MKEYIRPEIELIKFSTEAIANQFNGTDVPEDNIMSGDMS